MIKKYSKLCFFVIWLFSFSFGCVPVDMKLKKTEIPMVSVIETASITPTEKLIVQATAAYTSTNVNTKTPTLTPTKQPTKVPTLSEENIVSKIETLIKTNNGHELSDPLGLRVSQSSIYDKNNILSQFPELDTEEIYIEKSSNNIFFVIPGSSTENAVWASYDFAFKEDKLLCSRLSITYNDPTHRQVYDDAQFWEYIGYYRIGSVIEAYGNPTEIYLLTWDNAGIDPHSFEEPFDIPFYVIFYYAEKGFAIQYETYAVFSEDEYVIAYPQQSHISIWVWNSEVLLELNQTGETNDICKPLEFMREMNYQTIETATSLTISEFCMLFSENLQLDIPIKTDRDLWYPAY